MTQKIIDTQTAEHYLWGRNCDSWIFVDKKELSVKQERMPAGTKEQLHFHAKAQQFFFILKGTATFCLDQKTIIVIEHQGLLIEPTTKHFIANESNEQLDFIVISQPTNNNDRIELKSNL